MEKTEKKSESTAAVYQPRDLFPRLQSPPIWPDDYESSAVALVVSDCLTEIMHLAQKGKPDCAKVVWLDWGHSFSDHDVVIIVVGNGYGEVWRCCSHGWARL